MLCGSAWRHCNRIVIVRITLIGNYAPDAQESMRRYADLVRDGLQEAGHEVTLALPKPVLNRSEWQSSGVRKWIGYLDKYVVGKPELAHADIVHICDHSNSVYVPSRPSVPYVVTCHDLLAVRGALGEETDCPASASGRLLQRSILRGLARAQALACVSTATLQDAQRLLGDYAGRVILAPNALNYPYRVLEDRMIRDRLSQVEGLEPKHSYVLVVGSNLRRKNRECAIKAVAQIADQWHGQIVFAGQPLAVELRALAAQLHVADRVVDVVKPSNELLEALYCGATALLFPSRFEGFGWPIIEAQACACPVLCSDHPPLPEVAGDAALLFGADDYAGFGNAILTLSANPTTRESLRGRGLINAQRYERRAMTARFIELYQQLAPAA